MSANASDVVEELLAGGKNMQAVISQLHLRGYKIVPVNEGERSTLVSSLAAGGSLSAAADRSRSTRKRGRSKVSINAGDKSAVSSVSESGSDDAATFKETGLFEFQLPQGYKQHRLCPGPSAAPRLEALEVFLDSDFSEAKESS